MLNQRFRWYRLLNFMGDIAIVSVVWSAFYFGVSTEKNISLTSLLIWGATTWCIAALPQGLYNLDRVERLEQKFQKLFITFTVFTALQLLGANLLQTKLFDLATALIYSGVIIGIVTSWHLLLVAILKRTRASEHHFRKAIIVGNGRTTDQLADILRTHKG
jgi:FlaA1/EpsC-like NDP-sugar epimerase